MRTICPLNISAYRFCMSHTIVTLQNNEIGTALFQHPKGFAEAVKELLNKINR